MKRSTRNVLLTSDIGAIALGAILVAAMGVVWFARGIEVDAAGTTGYATALENSLFYGGLALLHAGVIAALILTRMRRRTR